MEGRPTPWQREGISDLALTRSRSDRHRHAHATFNGHLSARSRSRHAAARQKLISAFWSRRLKLFVRQHARSSHRPGSVDRGVDGGSTRGRGAVACNEKLTPAPG